LEKLFQYYDLNASSFAENIEVGRASISHLLSGRNKPSLDFVMKVVQTFPEVELYWLLNGKGNFPKQIETKEAQQEQSPLAPNRIQNKTPQEKAKSEDVADSNEEVSNRAANTEGKSIQRIVIFYNDGTFEAFNHS
jgi:plasmid maintenance system antidote protein VapI